MEFKMIQGRMSMLLLAGIVSARVASASMYGSLFNDRMTVSDAT
jgi:hypothetical protein